MHAAYYRIGGVHSNITSSILNDILLFLTKFVYRLDELQDILSSNSI